MRGSSRVDRSTRACLERKANATDAALNQSYGMLKAAVRRQAAEMGQRSKSALQSLTEAQRQWIAFRDVNCRFEDQLAFGGTSIGGNYSACLCALGLERAADFARIGRQLLPKYFEPAEKLDTSVPTRA